MSGAVGVVWLFWATLRYAARARRHSSALHTLQSSLLAARQLWRVPSTLPEDDAPAASLDHLRARV